MTNQNPNVSFCANSKTSSYKRTSPSAAGAVKKSKQERIEEIKAKRREEELKSKAPSEKKEEEEVGAMTAEEQLEEKRKAEEAQREADLESAKELFGGT